MKRIIAFLLAIMILLTGCTQPVAQTQPTSSSEAITETNQTNSTEESTAPTLDESLFEDEELSFTGLNDPALLQYTEDSVYANLR